MTSGLGGLGLEGIVGIEESEGEKAAFPGVGNKGSISGDIAGENCRGAPGRVVGAAEMVETCMFCREAKANEELHAIKAISITKNDQKEAINDDDDDDDEANTLNECVSRERTVLESGETEEVHH